MQSKYNKTMIKQVKDGICNIRTEANLRRIKKIIIINYSPDIAGEGLARQRGNSGPERDLKSISVHFTV